MLHYAKPFLVPKTHITLSVLSDNTLSESNISSLDLAMSKSSRSDCVMLHGRGLLLAWSAWTQHRWFCPLFIQTQMPKDITSSLVKQLPTSEQYVAQTTSRDERSTYLNHFAQPWKYHRIFLWMISSVYQLAPQLIAQLSFVLLYSSFVKNGNRLNLTKNQLS